MNKHLFSCILFAKVSVIFLLTVPESVAAPASLNDYWNGKADWKYVTSWSESSLGGYTLIDGIHIEVVVNDWYLFTRKTFPEAKLGTEVRHSANQGWSWSTPESGTPCEYAATDGQL